MGNVEYPAYLREKGFRFVERQPGTDKIPIRQASSRTTVPEHLRMSGAQFGNIIHNQTNAFNLANPDQIERGMRWYGIAHQIADSINPDIEKTAGVIAALSGNGTEWGQNVRNADTFIRTGKALSTNTKKQIEDATRIAEGEHYSTVLPPHLKTRNFADLIVNPNHPRAVAVDTQHHDASTGLKMPWKDADRGLDAIGRYDTLADATRIVADRKGVLPNQLQAVDWLVWKELGHPYRGHPRAIDIVRRSRG